MMMKKGILLTSFLSLFLITDIQSQDQYNWKRGILRGSTYLIPGISAGLHETILHHYSKFKKKFPKANDQYWDPRISWENKYRRDRFQRRFPVFTDAYHLTNAIKTGGLIGSTVIVTIGSKKKWWHYAVDLGIGFAFYSIGTNGTYELFNN